MGYRLHAAKKYEVEWSSNGCFNRMKSDILDELRAANVELHDYEEDSDYPSEFAIYKKDLDGYINSLKERGFTEDAEEWELVLKEAVVDSYGFYRFAWF